MTILSGCEGDSACGCPDPHPDSAHFTLVGRIQQTDVSTWDDNGEGGYNPPHYFRSETDLGTLAPGVYVLKYCGQGALSRVNGPGITAYAVIDANGPWGICSSIYTETDGNTFAGWVHNEPFLGYDWCPDGGGWMSSNYGGFEGAKAAVHSMACVSVAFAVSESQDVTLKFDGGSYAWTGSNYEPRCFPSGATWPEVQYSPGNYDRRIWWGLYAVSPELEVACTYAMTNYECDDWTDPPCVYPNGSTQYWTVWARVRSVLPISLTYEYNITGGLTVGPILDPSFTCTNTVSADIMIYRAAYSAAGLVATSVGIELNEALSGVAMPTTSMDLEPNFYSGGATFKAGNFTQPLLYHDWYLDIMNNGTLPSRLSHGTVAVSIIASTNANSIATPSGAYPIVGASALNQCTGSAQKFRFVVRFVYGDITQPASFTLQWTDAGGTEQMTLIVPPWPY